MPHSFAADFTVAEDCVLAGFAREGNDDALCELMSRYDYAIRMRSSSFFCSWLETEDLIQEGMIGLISAAKTFSAEGGASFRTYALLCIKRHMLSATKMASRQKHLPLNNYVSIDDETNIQAIALANVINPEDMVVCRENIGAVRNIVEKCLTGSERGILNMYLTGASYAAMASELKVSMKFVDNSLQRIRRKLVASLKG